MTVTVIIPAYNEAARIGDVVQEALAYADEIVVVDDGSTDPTGEVAAAAGARVARQPNAGYIQAIKRGFREASGGIVVTMDADGEHRAKDIPHLVGPIMAGEADLVLGKRPKIVRPSERFLNWLTTLRVTVTDSGTGFRALRKSLALKLELKGRCICGTSVLEAVAVGARVIEVPICLKSIDKPRRIAWFHVPQVWYVIQCLLEGDEASKVRGEKKVRKTKV